jgi:hypothetical protein
VITSTFENVSDIGVCLAHRIHDGGGFGLAEVA